MSRRRTDRAAPIATTASSARWSRSSNATASSCAIPERGLIDFPAQSPSGREYLLCWLAGEDAIEWWHWPDAGFAGRTPLSQPPE